MRRHLPVLVTAVVLFCGACGGGTSSAATLDLAPLAASDDPAYVAAALERTNEVSSFRYEISMTGEITGLGSIEMEMGGEADLAAEAVSMKLDFGSLMAGFGDLGEMPPGLDGDIEMRVIGDTAYMSSDLFGDLGLGSGWLAVPLGAAGDLFGSGGLVPSGGPEEMFESLEGVASVEIVGTETVRGTETTRVRAEIDPELFDAVAGDTGMHVAPVEIWIDEVGLMHRFSMTAAEVSGAFTMTMDVFDYGADVDIEVPSDVTVLDGEMLGPQFTS